MVNVGHGSVRDYKEVIKEIEPFNYLDEKVLEEALDNLEIRSHPRGSYVFRQGDPRIGVLFIVLEGRVELFITGDNGEEINQGFRKPYNFFGEPSFFTADNYAASARALEDVICLTIDEETFDDLADTNPEFSLYFQRALGERIKGLYERFVVGRKVDPADEYSLEEDFLKSIVKEGMITSVVVCDMKDTVKDIARLMEINDVSSVVVVDEANHPLGIVTEEDLTYKVVAYDLPAGELKAENVYSDKLITISPDEYMHHALITMVKQKIKHLIVVEKTGELAGILTIGDFVKSRKSEAFKIIESLENAKEIDDLLEPRDYIDSLLDELVKERASAEMICEIITEFYDRLTQKVIEISETEMVEEGYGVPPVNYSFINMGSSGRKEQFMRTDQDNGIIFEDPYKKDEEEVQNYFLTLGEKIVNGLIKCGFKECPGGVMAKNPEWCRSFKSWRKVIKEWTNNPDAENVRLMTIFLDFRHIYGQKRYCDLLKNFVVRTFRESHVALQFLVKDDVSRKPPIGFFKQIKAKKDKKRGEWINIKSAAFVHIVDCLRVFSLREGIIETNTYERLERLKEKNVLSKDNADFIYASYEALMMIRIKDSVEKMNRGETPDNIIALDKLSKWEKNILRECLLAVDRLQNLTAQAFHILG